MHCLTSSDTHQCSWAHIIDLLVGLIQNKTEQKKKEENKTHSYLLQDIFIVLTDE